MTEEEAYEYYNYNMLGAWVGDGTPAFICLHSESMPFKTIRRFLFLKQFLKILSRLFRYTICFQFEKQTVMPDFVKFFGNI